LRHLASGSINGRQMFLSENPHDGLLLEVMAVLCSFVPANAPRPAATPEGCIEA
jgi:hypothetical protein